MIEGYSYGDATTQHLLSKSQELKDAISRDQAPEQISSMQQLKQYVEINKYIDTKFTGETAKSKSNSINKFILDKQK